MSSSAKSDFPDLTFSDDGGVCGVLWVRGVPYEITGMRISAVLDVTIPEGRRPWLFCNGQRTDWLASESATGGKSIKLKAAAGPGRHVMLHQHDETHLNVRAWDVGKNGVVELCDFEFTAGVSATDEQISALHALPGHIANLVLEFIAGRWAIQEPVS